ncbi:MAG: hypothetical protein KBT12_04270 [Bacteroidales bacterium]|nr:hypothetical protein [Candidatus Physcousia equi]
MELNEELLFAEEDRQVVEFIKNYLPQDVKERFSEDNIYYMLDLFAEYCEKSGVFDTEDEDADSEIDVEEAAKYMARLAKKEDMGNFDPEDIRWIVEGELEYEGGE